LSLTVPVQADVCIPAPPVITQSGYYGVPAYPLAPVTVQALSPVFVPPAPTYVCPEFVPPVIVPRQMPPAPVSVPNVSEFRQNQRPARSYDAATSFYRAAYYTPSETPRERDLATLSLNNASDRALLVWVDGVRYLLVEGQTLTREVGRDFTWHVEGREKKQGRAPAGQEGVRIVIDR
jgi:hypothetical protein